MSSITLTPALAQAVREGRKTVHRVPCNESNGILTFVPEYQLGCRLILLETQPYGKAKVFGTAKITDLRQEHLEDITDSEIRREGYASWALFSNAWDDRHGRTHGQAIMNPLCWRIEFVLES
ncbi:hypothetical protein BJP27_24255 (plasmid) [Pseudomonas oryzihabitans]|nr:hypothetical protein BJP27_24255 [Pseudomonas psychrotolerans]